MPKTILYGVLNWGLGHATRSIPIIEYLLAQNHNVVIASDGAALTLLKKEFPNQFFEDLPPYDVIYPKKAALFGLKMLFQLPKFTKAMHKEQKLVQSLCEKHRVTHIISDHRYGIYHQNLPSAIVCHQLRLLYPQNALIEFSANQKHRKLLDNFDEIWLPDFSVENSIAGSLSKKRNEKVKTFGVLSRMQKIDLPLVYDYCVVLSGPEPQRTLLEEKLLIGVDNLPIKIAFVRGVVDKKMDDLPQIKNVTMFDYLTSDALNELVCKSKTVICRSGYSSIMDLVKLEKKAILIPTPGQTEQEYLARFLQKKGMFISVKQKDFDWKKMEALEKMLKSGSMNEKSSFHQIIESFIT